MPFQSEKQRRYLHANHPEIAKRWERDYANGGITLPKGPAGITSLNGWGSKDSSQNKAGADITASMDKNPNDPGWGGGGGGKGPPSGPTAEEIAAAKAAAEAKKKALEDAKYKTWLTDTKKKKKKKTDWIDKTLKTADTVDKLYKFGTTLNPLNLYKTNPYILGGSLLKNLYDKNKKPDANKSSTTLNFKDPWKNKDLVYNETTGNFENKLTGEIVNQSLPGATQAKTFNTMEELMTIPGATQEKVWGSDHKLTSEGKNLGKFIESSKKLHGSQNPTTGGGTIENIKSWMTDDKRQNIYKDYLNESGTDFNETIKDAIDKGLFEKKKDFTEQVNILEVKDGGPIRKKYYKGSNGILDIDEESEDISLTAFNPKFDDVPELTEEKEEEKIDLFSETEEGDPLNELLLAEDGVTTLFRAKNGGYAVQGGVKNYLGEQEMVSAPKYWQSAPDHPETELTYITKPEKNLLVKADLHGSLHGNVNKGPQGITSLNGWGDADDGFGSSGDTSDGGWGNDPQGEFGGIDSGGWDPGVFSPGTTPSGENVNTSPNVTTISGGDIWDWDETSEIDDVYETFQNVKHRYDKNKTTQGWKMVINMLTGNLGGIVSTGYGMHKDKKAYEEMLNKLKQDAIDLGIPEYNPHTDTLIQTINQEVIDINKKRETEPQESDGPEPVAPVIKELTEYEQMAWDPMSYLDKIRAGQAQRASLQAKGIIQDNEIMTLNSGGLANLFTVKNYN